jgi:two-component sensor histidine kinase
MEALKHPREGERLQALRAYEVLDTEPEKDFDDIARLAAALCEAPISVVNLVDAERQWFKAETGLGVRETPLASSICAHAILEEDFVEIPDTLADPRMRDNPLCAGREGLRFYAGALLRTEAGLPIGTLCVLDHAPRRLTPLQRDALRVLARQVMAQLEMRWALRTAAVLRQEVDHRVKNSLQSLSSFARLQGRAVVSEEAASVLSRLTGRIDAMVELHEQLYRQEAGAAVDLDAFVRRLCARLERLAPTGVVLRVTAEPVVVDTRQAMAAGTLVNELVSNAFKHGFPEGRPGEVRVALERQGDGTVRLACSDTGVGPEASPSPEAAGEPGLGMRIVEVARLELDGELALDGGPDGFAASLRFAPRVPEADAGMT